MFQKHQPEANVKQALVSQSNNNIQFGVQKKRERRDNSLLRFCNSYCKPSTAAEIEATCKESNALAVKMAVEKEAGLCKKSTAMAVKKSIEKQAGLCKKSIADAVNVEKEEEATWCKKNSVMVEKVGPFKASKENKIGEIKKYYHNYEFSMDLRFAESALQNPSLSQILVGIV